MCKAKCLYILNPYYILVRQVNKLTNGCFAAPNSPGEFRMQPSKQNISIPKIEKEIYNTFEQFKQEKNIKIVDYLKIFDVNLLKNREYRSIDYTYESFIRLILFHT